MYAPSRIQNLAKRPPFISVSDGAANDNALDPTTQSLPLGSDCWEIFNWLRQKHAEFLNSLTRKNNAEEALSYSQTRRKR